jgi:hypothetical protein
MARLHPWPCACMAVAGARMLRHDPASGQSVCAACMGRQPGIQAATHALFACAWACAQSGLSSWHASIWRMGEYAAWHAPRHALPRCGGFGLGCRAAAHGQPGIQAGMRSLHAHGWVCDLRACAAHVELTFAGLDVRVSRSPRCGDDAAWKGARAVVAWVGYEPRRCWEGRQLSRCTRASACCTLRASDAVADRGRGSGTQALREAG